MGDEQPRSPQRGWRDAKGSAAGGGKSGPAWKGDVETAKSGKQPWSRKTRLQIALGLFGAVVGAIVLILFLVRPAKPFRLVVLSAGYEQNLAIPQNALGRKAAADLAAWGKENPRFVEVYDRKPLTLDLSGLKEATDGCKAQTVVVFISAHGSADDEGVYLVPEDADLKKRDSSRLRLEDVLKQLETLPAETKKLLILDTTQVSASWTLGFFHNDFARQLKGLEARIKQSPGLVVLAASDENQRSWVSEEWRQSIFAHHVLEGLRGAADPGSTRIFAYDLYRHVADKVKQWARNNRGALQTPILLGGDERARLLELLAVAKTYQPPDPLLQKSPVLPPELEKAWAERDRLAAQTPPPAVYTPHVWREYEETLLRYEQLLRADDRESAAKVLADTPRLRNKIEAARVRKLDSALGTLAMPAALGWETPPLDAARVAEVKALLEKGGQDAALKEKFAGWLGTEKELWKKQLLRVRLAGLLLQLAVDNPARNLEPVHKLLTAPEDVSASRPAEAQYLVLLTRDLTEPKWDLVKEGLLLRRQAEEAAVGLTSGEGAGAVPFSEAILSWTRSDLDKADRERRLGLDLLLATADKDRKEAADRLGKARDLYRDAQKTAARIRRALLLRDRALTDLPYYSQWLASRRFIGENEQVKRLTEPIEDNLRLWELVNALDQALIEQAAVDATLEKTTEAVAREFAALEKEFTARYNQSHTILQENWHEIDGLLTVPLIPARRRMELLTKLQQISARLNEEGDKAGGAEGMTADQTKLLAREGARAQGKMALSALGRRVFDASKGKGEGEYEKTRQAIWFSPDGSWQKNLYLAGDEVARRWNQVPGVLDQLVTLSRNVPFAEALKLIPRLGASARRLPGALAPWLLTDPVDEQRRLQLHDLLCLQGERTFQDFLAADTPGQGGAYYQLAGLVYHDDALAQLQPPGGAANKMPARLKRVAELKDILTDKERKLAVAWSLDDRTFQPSPATLPLTDEEELPLWYGVRGVKVPEGYPVLWQDLKDQHEFLQPAPAAGRAVQRGLGGDPGKVAAVYPIVRRRRVNAPPTVQHATQLVNARFRGHELLAETKISHFGVPDWAASLPALPEGGRLAVQTTPEIYRRYGEGSGAIVFILDCSGSMRARQSDGTTRFDQAKKALLQVLENIPTGTQVSLWAFAHKTRVSDGTDMSQWGPERTIEELVPPQKWEAKKRALIKAKIKDLEPWNNTPILRSMLRARNDFKPQQGFKTMVILTDGMDTDIEPCFDNKNQGAADLNPKNQKRVIPTLLQEYFGKSDIAIRIIGFQLPETERPIAEEQFKVPLEKLPKKGRFYDIRDTDKLIEALKESIQQRLFFALQDSNNQPVRGHKRGVEVSLMRFNRQPVELKPGYYYLDSDALRLRQKIEIKRGDYLRINLFETRDGFALQRDLVEKSYPDRLDFPRRETKDWRVTVLENLRDIKEDAARMMVAIEYLKDREFGGEGVLSQITPSLILFQVKRPDDPKAPQPSLRFRPLAAYAAPSWELQVRPWQREKAPQLEVFWSEDPPEKAKILRRGQHFNPLNDKWAILPAGAEFKAVLSKGEEGSVRLLSLRLEKHTVDTYEGKPRKDVSCFVVRMSYPPGKPVMVQFPNHNGGQEHRFYNTAGKYTGIFWEMTAQEAQNRVETLNVISLDAFREAAEASRQHVRIDLRPPDLTQRPPPQ